MLASMAKVSQPSLSNFFRAENCTCSYDSGCGGNAEKDNALTRSHEWTEGGQFGCLVPGKDTEGVSRRYVVLRTLPLVQRNGHEYTVLTRARRAKRLRGGWFVETGAIYEAASDKFVAQASLAPTAKRQVCKNLGATSLFCIYRERPWHVYVSSLKRTPGQRRHTPPDRDPSLCSG